MKAVVFDMDGVIFDSETMYINDPDVESSSREIWN